MNFTRIALKLRAQIHKVADGFHSLSKPRRRFVEEMIYGIQASKDVKLSEIGRALDENVTLKKTEERLSRHLKQPGLDKEVNRHIAKLGSRRVHEDTLLIIDPSDIRKPYARKMPHLARVRDGSTGEIVNGYWTCHITACEPLKRRGSPISTTTPSPMVSPPFSDAPDKAPSSAENPDLLTMANYGSSIPSEKMGKVHYNFLLTTHQS